MKFSGILACVVVVAFALARVYVARAADANPPEFMTYQGYLVDGNGARLGDGAPANYDVVFRIYNVKQGGGPENLLWAEQQTITVDMGYFSVLLGEGTKVGNLPRSDDPTSTGLLAVFLGADSSDRYIGITVRTSGDGSDVEIAPRLRLVASPFTFLAAYARQADRIVDADGDVLTTDGGNIGIGNASPDAKLDVGGDIKASGAVDVGGDANVQGQLAVGKSSAPDTALDVEGKVKASDGLDVEGNSSIDGTLTLTPSGSNNALEIEPASGTSYKLSLRSDSSASYIRNNSSQQDLRLGANSLDAVTIKPSGKVGIGTTNPRGQLDVYTGNSTLPGLIIDRYPTGNYRSELVQASDGLAIRVGYGATEPTEKIRIKHDGNVLTSGWIERTAHEAGGLMGAYGTLSGAAQASNPIYTLSKSHKPNETTLGNMYGVGYTDYTASFITGGASGWGFYVAADGDARTWLSGNPGGVSYIAKDGGRVGIGTDSPSQALHVQGNIFASGTITPSSDRRAKTDLEPVDPKEVLERVVDLPIERWRFKTEDEGVKHVGPMAQDFHEAFGLGESDTAIATVDADGVALAAIQGLNLRLNEKDAEIQVLREEVALLKASLSRLEEQAGAMGKMGQGL